MNRKNIFKGLILGLGILTLQSCDKDYNTLGNGVIGEPNFDIETYTVSDLVTYNQATGNNGPDGVESSNLSEINLGVYNNPVFGSTTASFVTALNFTNLPTEFGKNLEVDSVYLYIPYFSEIEKYDDNNKPVYKLNNKYGDGTFDLKIHQNGYYLYGAAVGGANDGKHFYSDDRLLFDNVKGSLVLNNSQDRTQNSNFTVNASEIVIYKRDKDGNIIQEGEDDAKKDAVQERLAPGLFADLDKEYFKQAFLDNRDQINEANSFRNYFRGLYFSVTPNGNEGALIKLDMSRAKMVIRYSQDKEDKEGKVSREHKILEYGITTASPKISFFNNAFNASYTQALSTADKTNGDEKLFLKGGEGSFGVISLFNQNEQEELKRLKEQELLINEAILTIYIDETAMGAVNSEPERLYLYNLDEQKLLLDYVTDANKTSNPALFKSTFGGFIEKKKDEDNKRGIRYRFKVTDHVRNLIKQDGNYSPKLALVSATTYTSDEAVASYKKLRTEIDNKPNPIKALPMLEVETPLGTVLHGSNTSDEKKRMKLEIFYTKTKN